MSSDYFNHWMMVRYSAHAAESMNFSKAIESLSRDELRNRTYVSERFLRWLPKWMSGYVPPAYRVEVKRAIPYLCVLQECQDEAWGPKYGKIFREVEIDTLTESKNNHYGNFRKSN